MWSISSLCVLRTSFVMSASTPSTCGEGRSGYLHDALFGSRIASRSECDGATARLDCILKGLMDVLRRELGDSEATDQAILEMGRVTALSTKDHMSVQAKRAAVLYALWQEPDVQEHFRRHGEAALVDDLCTRVLPLVMPRFVANQCQTPDAAVVTTAVLHSMWAEGDIGAAKPRLHCTTRQDNDGGDGEGA
jgi:hypothetical protein